jgi:hypothetical protein
LGEHGLEGNCQVGVCDAGIGCGTIFGHLGLLRKVFKVAGSGGVGSRAADESSSDVVVLDLCLVLVCGIRHKLQSLAKRFCSR